MESNLFFELHFSSLPDSNPHESYQQKLSRREEYFSLLKTVSGISKNLEGHIKHCIHVQKQRADVASRNNEAHFTFNNNSHHRPGVIEVDIINHIAFTLESFSGQVFCFDCSEKCKDSHPENSVHVVVEVRGVENTEANINFITVVVDKTVQKHNIPCGDITFVAPTSLSKEDSRF